MAEQRPGTFKKGEKKPNQGKRGQGKITKELKDMILGALDKSGGIDYLVTQAEENPNAFLGLVGKVLPMTVQGAGDNGEIIVKTTVTSVSANRA